MQPYRVIYWKNSRVWRGGKRRESCLAGGKYDRFLLRIASSIKRIRSFYELYLCFYFIWYLCYFKRILWEGFMLMPSFLVNQTNKNFTVENYVLI